jgi:transcriptional regulator with XRE-family HTH domain
LELAPFFYGGGVALNVWLQKKFKENKLTLKLVAKKTGLHTSSLSGYVCGEYAPRLINLIAIVEVISIVEDSSPRRLLVEALLSIDELTYAEERYNKRTSAKTKHLPAFKT